MFLLWNAECSNKMQMHDSWNTVERLCEDVEMEMHEKCLKKIKNSL